MQPSSAQAVTDARRLSEYVESRKAHYRRDSSFTSASTDTHASDAYECYQVRRPLRPRLRVAWCACAGS